MKGLSGLVWICTTTNRHEGSLYMCEIDAVFLAWSPITCLHKVPIGKSSDYSHEYIDGFLHLNFLKFYFMYFSHFLNRVL